MPTVRDILGDEFATLQGQGKTDDEIKLIAKKKLDTPPQIIPQVQTPPQKQSQVPAWYKGQSDNSILNFGGDVLRGAGQTGVSYANALVGGSEKLTNVLQKLEAINEQNKESDRKYSKSDAILVSSEDNKVTTPTFKDDGFNKEYYNVLNDKYLKRKEQVDALKKNYLNADTFGEKFSAGLDSVYDTLANPKEWQVANFAGNQIDPINAFSAGTGWIWGATIGMLTNSVQAAAFSLPRSDKSGLDVAVDVALGATAGTVLGAVVGGLTKKKGSKTETLQADEIIDAPLEGTVMNDSFVDENGMVHLGRKKRDVTLEAEVIKKNIYKKFALVIQEEEAQVIKVDADIKALGYEMKLKGASDAEIEVAVAQKLSPTPQALAITNILNDGKPITPRLSGLNLQQAIVNSIENSKLTKEEFYQNILKHGVVNEMAIAATKAYDTKEISNYSIVAHDKLTQNIEQLVDVPNEVLKAQKKDNSYDLAYEALPIQEARTATQQSALFGNEQQLFDVPSETKLVTPKWAESLTSTTVKYEDIVRDITNAKNGAKPTSLAKRAMSAMANDELKGLVKHERFSEVLDFTRENEGRNSPQRLESPRKVSTVDTPSSYKTTIDRATYSKNYQYDFTLTKAKVKRIESGKPTFKDIEDLKEDLAMMENNPTYALPTEEELKARYEQQALNPETIFDDVEFSKLQQRFDPETYAQAQEMFGETIQEISNDTSTTRDLARDIQDTGTKNSSDARTYADERGANNNGVEQSLGTTTKLRQQSDTSTSDSTTPLFGKSSDTAVHTRDTGTSSSSSTPRNNLDGGSGSVDGSRVQTQQGTEVQTSTELKSPENKPSDASLESSNTELRDRVAAQKKAEYIPLDLNNPQNIRDTLPILLDKQQDDVIKAENRLFGEADERGMLFTNGTGTGKTFTGLGVIKRSLLMDKKDIVILVPSRAKALDWIEDAKLLGMKVRELKDTKDSGEGDIVVTTYENLRDNKTLVARDIDLLVADESHKIMGNKEGKHTANLSAVQELTNHYRAAKARAREEFAPQRETLVASIKKVGGRYEKDAAPFIDKEKEVAELELQRAMDLNKKTKTVLLSASPFASHKSLRYADDILFNFKKDKWRDDYKGSAYNAGDSEDSFFMSNFGYKMRYNKLTKPDAEVNLDMMERAFAEKLRESGAMSGRKLEVDKDYQRAFILVDSELGKKIDAGFEKLSDDKEFTQLRSVMRSSYMDTVSLMESIKANEAVARVKEHLALGRKVVLYHTFVEAQPKHPFKLDEHIKKAIAKDETGQLKTILEAEYAAFKSKYPELYNMDLGELDTPTSIIKDAFGDKVVFFNGKVTNKNKSLNLKKFNDNEVDIIMLNESGKEGISLHDKHGDKQRVLINLTLPIKPIDMIQVEGRTYRTGQKSNAIFEYLTLHTNFEKRYFGSSINERVATVENLAMGEESRSLRSSIKNGYLDADTKGAKELNGLGGKEYDARSEGDRVGGDPFAYAKTLFYGKTKGRQNHRGADFFATPDPLGFKMVEWANIKSGERVLEPSAGVGAIGKWFPADTVNHFVEQSSDLFSDLGIAVQGNLKQMSFEDLDIINKYDAVVMNPPYGKGSKVAIEHLQKAMLHTAPDGRIVLLAPNNMMQKASFKKMLSDNKFAGFELQDEMKLPQVTFKSAGTSVMTSVYVFNKTSSKDMLNISNRYTKDIQGEDINMFFDEIEGLGVEPRKGVATAEEVVGEVSAVISGKLPIQLGIFKHTKTGENMTVVKFADKISKEDYKTFSGEIKEFGGYWSRYAKGFLFKNEASAQTFKNGINDGSVKLNAMFFPYADKVADLAVNFDKYADSAYKYVSDFVRDVDADGIPKAVRESKNAPHQMANNFFGWMRDNMVLGGGRATHYLDILRDYTDMKGRIADEALNNRKIIDDMLSEDESIDLVRSLGGDLPASELNTKVKGAYELYRGLIDKQTDELVKLGALDAKYVKEDYVKRYYFEHIAKEKSFVNMAGGKANSVKFAREDLSLDERIELGQVEDAGYVVAKTIMEQKDQINRAKLFKRIADDISSEDAIDGYVLVPDIKLGIINKWGALNGKYIPKQVFSDLKGSAKMMEDMSGMEQAINIWFSSMQHIKTNMTVKNVGTHVYNVASNGYLAYLDGHMSELARIIKEPEFYMELYKEANRFGLDSMLDDLEGITFKETSTGGVLTTLLKNAYMAEGTVVGNAMRKAYAHEDAAFKLAAYLKRKEQMQLDKFLAANKELKVDFDMGVINAQKIKYRYKKDIRSISLSEEEKGAAFRGVDEVYVNYGTPLPSAIKNLDRSGLFPFMHYTWKATPIFLKQMGKHPYKVAMLHVMAGSYGISKVFGEQDDREEVTPEWMNDSFNMLGLDGFKEVNEGQYLNIGRSVPGMRFMDKSPVSILLGLDGGILANLFGIAVQGRDNKGYAVDGGKYDSTAVKVAKRASAAATQVMPPLFPALPLVVRPKIDTRGNIEKDTTEIVAFGGRYFQKAYDAFGGKKDKRGNPLSIGDVAKQAVGAKLQRVDKLSYAQKSVNSARKLYEREYALSKSSRDRVNATRKFKDKMKKIKVQLPLKERGSLKIKNSVPNASRGKMGRVFSKKQMIKL